MITAVLFYLLSLLHRLLPHLPTVISSHIYALLTLLNLGLNLPIAPPPTITTRTLPLSTPLETHIVSTFPLPPPPHARTILVIHGLAPSAHNDPRILHLATAIATAQPSTLVLVPHIPPLAKCDLAANPVDLIHSLLLHIANDKTLTPSANLSIVSTCISAGFSLVAAARAPEVMQSVLTIGTHSSVESVMRHIIARRGKGDTRYASNSLLASFIKPRTALRDLLVAYVDDDHYKNLGRHADAHILQTLLPQHPDAAKTYHRLQDDSVFLEEYLEATYKDNLSVMQGMSPIEYLHALKLESLVLVHSQTDDVVPCQESVIIRDALRDREDIRTKLCVTSLLDHGDKKTPSIQDVPAILRLVNAFAVFFAHSNVPNRAQTKKD